MCEGLLQDDDIAAFPASGRPHHHKTMPDTNHFIQLEYLSDENRNL